MYEKSTFHFDGNAKKNMFKQKSKYHKIRLPLQLQRVKCIHSTCLSLVRNPLSVFPFFNNFTWNCHKIFCISFRFQGYSTFPWMAHKQRLRWLCNILIDLLVFDKCFKLSQNLPAWSSLQRDMRRDFQFCYCHSVYFLFLHTCAIMD